MHDNNETYNLPGLDELKLAVLLLTHPLEHAEVTDGRLQSLQLPGLGQQEGQLIHLQRSQSSIINVQTLTN